MRQTFRRKCRNIIYELTTAAVIGLAILPATPAQAASSIIEYPLNVLNVTSLVRSFDDNMWFIDTDYRVGKITPDGTLTWFRITADNGDRPRPTQLALGPDGNMWFIAENRTFGNIAPSGRVTVYPNLKDARYITAGPDGNLWFTYSDDMAIGKFTPNGKISEYPFKEAAMFRGIAAGPDGNVWFISRPLSSRDKIGKITPDGKVTEYNTPEERSIPAGIVAGPDGNMWFTESASNKIAKITPSGHITEHAIPTLNAEPFGLAFDFTGNVWFAESNKNRIGKMSPSGGFSEYHVPSPLSRPWAIELGTDAMWFLEQNGKIAKFPLSQTRRAPRTNITGVATQNGKPVPEADVTVACKTSLKKDTTDDTGAYLVTLTTDLCPKGSTVKVKMTKGKLRGNASGTVKGLTLKLNMATVNVAMWGNFSISLKAAPTTQKIGDPVTLTSTSTADAGSPSFWTLIYDADTGTRIGVCRFTTTCSAKTSQSAAATHRFVAYISDLAAVYPPTGIQATSNSSFATWANTGYTVSLSAEVHQIGHWPIIDLTAASNKNLGQTPYWLQIYNIRSGERLAACRSGTTCSVRAGYNFGPNDYVAFTAPYSRALPPPDTQASSNVYSFFFQDYLPGINRFVR